MFCNCPMVFLSKTDEHVRPCSATRRKRRCVAPLEDVLGVKAL